MADDRRRLARIQASLTAIDGPELSINYFSVESLEEFAQYPRDFRLFLEEIGNIDIKVGMGVGYQLLAMDDPQPLIGINDESETNLYSLDEFLFDDFCFGNHLAQNIRIFAVDVDANLYGFDIGENKFELVGTDLVDGEFSTFTDWFVSFMNNQVNNMPWLPQVKFL